MSEGATNKDVAAHLFLSRRTVDYHLRRNDAARTATHGVVVDGKATVLFRPDP